MSQFFMPVRIVEGENCIRENAELFSGLGRRALIVTGKSSKTNGALDDAFFALSSCGREYAVFDEIPQNPTLACVRAGGEAARAFGADFVVALGGGSPMDAAKAIAMLAVQDVSDLFACEAKCVLPMVHVPTTAGTGSEVTQYSILTNDEKQTKTSISSPLFFPRLAFLDGRYLCGLPRAVTVNTAIDALSHAVEGMLSVRAGALSDALARSAIAAILGEFEGLRTGELSAPSRADLLRASTLAGMVIANTGTTPVHGMGYSLTYFAGIPHGRANGLLLPAFLEACLQKVPERVRSIYSALGTDANGFAEKMNALLGVRERFPAQTLADWAERASHNKNIKNCSAHFEKEDLLAVLKRSLL